MIWTPALEELRENCMMDGSVGEIKRPGTGESESDLDLRAIPWNPGLTLPILILLGLVPLAILGSMTRFAVGKSTSAERGWIMSCIVVSVATPTLIGLSDMMGKKLKQGLNLRPENEKSGKEKQMKETLRSISYVIFLSSLAPVIGGFIVVGQMLREFGVCTLKQ